MIIKKIVAVLIAALPVTALAQVNLSRAALDSLVYPAVRTDGAEILKFEQLHHDMGDIGSKDAPQTVSFTFTNISKEEQHISNIRTSCGCTKAECNVEKLKPGEKGVVKLTYNPYQQSGAIRVSAFIYTTTGTPTARLTLSGNVVSKEEKWAHLPICMGNLRLKRNSVEIDTQKEISTRIPVANAGNKPLQIKAAMLPKEVTLYTEPPIIKAGMEADIVISATAKAEKTGNVAYSILLEGIDALPQERILKLTIK